MATVTCPHCGHPNPLGSHFCSSCGKEIEGPTEHGTTASVLVPLDSNAEEVRVELDELPPGVGMLVVTRGPNSGSRFALDEPIVTAGRHPDSVIFLDDITVSRLHAEIRQIDGGYELADVGSLNGTYLNRERVEQCNLQDGDELQIGTFKLLFLAGSSVSGTMADRSHLSIGEVLSLLQDDFPDVTISKIRFLESQGLLDPERTPSGYRKFYEGDIERLRWILRHQRDHFLPLKVIKDRLEESAARGLMVPPDEPMSAAEAGAAGADASPPQHMSSAPAVEDDAPGPDDAFSPIPAAVRARPGRNLAGLPAGDAPAPAPVVAPVPAPVAAAPVAVAPVVEPAPAPTPEPAPAPAPRPAPVGRPAPTMPPLPVPAETAGRTPLDGGVSGGSFSADELLAASGLDARDLAELTRFGLVVGRTVGGDTFYDEDALVAARSAAGFVKFGIEARHLRMYKVAAEREAGFMEQVVMPLLKQRNPTARQQAAETLGELARLGDLMRAALLRTALRDHTEPR